MWILLGLTFAILGTAIAIFVGRTRTSNKTDRIVELLVAGASTAEQNTVDFDDLSNLPPPVIRYFRHVLADDQKLIKTATMYQSGVLRTRTTTDAWSSFTARQVVAPFAPGFVWDATVELPLATHVRVLDRYRNGVGGGQVSLLSAFTVASEAGQPELNSGALHRYLAEAVWYPTALLPQSGVVWSAIDGHSAKATLTDDGVAVSLEFRFNAASEVVTIYSPGRFGKFNGSYERVPWEGHFRDYQTREGMQIPCYGEVGWYQDKTLQLVWKGTLTEVKYQYERLSPSQ